MTLKELVAKNKPKLDTLHPKVKAKAIQWEINCYKRGVPALVTRGFSTIQEQNNLYALGRTRPGNIVTNAKGGDSFHNYKVAWDFVPLDSKGQPIWDSNHKYWKICIEEAEKLGIESGSRWKFVDKPHLQVTFGLTLKDFKAGKVIK